MYRLILATFLPISTVLAQGSLTPPGAPAPMMKTLDQIEARTPISTLPFTINNSGSYYLTTNLSFTGTGHGITVNATDVTIDLNGFALAGNGSSLQTNGIYVGTTILTLNVKNGTVRSWKHGVNSTNASVGSFSDLQFLSCSNGLVTAGLSVVQRCTATSLTGVGIQTGNGSTIRDCTAATCTGGGVSLGNGSTIVNCSFVQNAGTAITAGSGCTIRECTVFNNNGIGILTAGHCLISGCTVASGFNTGISTSVSTVEHCTVNNNTGDGILAGTYSKLAYNEVYGNGNGSGSNIHVTGNFNRIEDNHSTFSIRGFKVDGIANVIIRNSAGANNTNYVIGATNGVGAYVGIAATASSTSPTANYDY